MTTETPAPFAHWMLREIYEQPETLAATLRQYVSEGSFRSDTCAPLRQWLGASDKGILIAASGSSRHAGLIAEQMIEDLSGIVVDVEYASEYSYRSERALMRGTALAISQSGETVDTLAALRRAIHAGQGTLAIANVSDSSMAREAGASMPTCAGRERAVPATKSFTAQVLNVYLLALLAAETRGTLSADEHSRRLQELASLPERVRVELPSWERSVRAIAEQSAGAQSFLFVGRGVHYPIAREGALKLKEASYLHAEGYPSGELKHGPNALLSDTTPLVMLATVDRSDNASVERYGKVLQLMRDMRQQDATIIAIANTGDAEVASLADHVLSVEEASDPVLAISEIIPLQLFAYYKALQHGIDVDHPRNLNKAVLSE